MIQPTKEERANPIEAAILYVVYRQSLPQVAAHLGTTSPTVLRFLRKLGIPRRSIGDGKSIRCRGNRSKAHKGYIYVNIGKGQRVLEHAHVASATIGRPLLPSEVVHHINGDRCDNRPENLMVMSRSAHTVLHTQKRANNVK